MSDDLWEREETRPTANLARGEAFRSLAANLADRLESEAARRSQEASSLDRQTADSCRALARRARVIASRFAACTESTPWDAAMNADVEAYFEMVRVARGYGLEVNEATPPRA